MLSKVVCFIALIKCVVAPPLPLSDSNSRPLDFWLIRLLVNLLGYATIAVPAFFIVRYLRKTKYNERGKAFLMKYPIVFGFFITLNEIMMCYFNTEHL